MLLLSYSTPPYRLPRNSTHSVSPISSSLNPNQPSNSTLLKMPTAPWMNSPILLQPDDLLHHANNNNSFKDRRDESESVFTGKTGGKRGDKDVKMIAWSLQKLQEKVDNESDFQVERKAVEDEEFRLGGMFEKMRMRMKVDADYDEEAKLPWDKRDMRGEVYLRRSKKEKVVTKAEMILDKGLLDRLRYEARSMRKWVKVKKAGVTWDVVNQIRLIWRSQDLAMVKFDVPLCRNMDRACEIIEMKTRGLVVWTIKDSVFVYKVSKPSKEMHRDDLTKPTECTDLPLKLNENSQPFKGINLSDVVVHGSLYEREADRLLEGLGPRYADWWMSKPLPVDGDLLPELIPGYRPPPRRSPPYGKSSITDSELTYLRKLAQPLPTHFVIGRNRRLQGLATAIVKLWEKTHVVKIAIKWGAINTSNQQMARELKDLTGGVLLLRNKYLIILYRGNDFLPSGTANSIMDRDAVLGDCLLNEEDARLRAAHDLSFWYSGSCTSALGTLSEHQVIGTLKSPSVIDEAKIQLEAEKQKLEKELRIQEHKFFILNKKMKRSAVELSEINSNWIPSMTSADTEIITEEERECLLKIALKSSRSLVLGRRGIFDGVIEGIHQHWKYREVVTVITMQGQSSQIIQTATMLEAESRGVLVAIKKLKKGYAIVLYRGKNYKRPSVLETKNLLTKREAYLRSIEMQRFGSLKFFANQRQRKITDLKSKLEDLEKQMQGVS